MQKCTRFLFIDHIDQSECSRIRYSILIGQLTGSYCESFEELLLNFKELIRGTAKLELIKVKYFRNASIAATVRQSYRYIKIRIEDEFSQ